MVNIHYNRCDGNLIAREVMTPAVNREDIRAKNNCDSVIFLGRSISLATTGLSLSCLSKVRKVWYFFIDLQECTFFKTLIKIFEKKFTGICIKSGNLYASFNFNFGPVTIIQQSGRIIQNEQKESDSKEKVEEPPRNGEKLNFIEPIGGVKSRIRELQDKEQEQKEIIQIHQVKIQAQEVTIQTQQSLLDEKDDKIQSLSGEIKTLKKNQKNPNYVHNKPQGRKRTLSSPPSFANI
ncbi:hypothetical protein PNK_p0042 (plasmid) [Candidatus Protochlamydia naegleriophila]|uniref:Uncharacterized protein n=1 Tax=Candidatus Protochlamydia naegleriophila TaxID=389348 RepID=A0A0U5EV02_9BACT|nr:hypothetical protein [Candidatus Protochlamydia naegleriophila]CUI18096.1 hypothetical protein PNK_p0042 [Candidatus Protochlamydia naegleriophila]